MGELGNQQSNGEVKHVADVPGQVHEFRPLESAGANDDCVYMEVPQPQPDPKDEYIAKVNKELEAARLQLARADHRVQLMRTELQQYRQDLVFWKAAHASEYPARRLTELEKKMQEIDAV